MTLNSSQTFTPAPNGLIFLMADFASSGVHRPTQGVEYLPILIAPALLQAPLTASSSKCLQLLKTINRK